MRLGRRCRRLLQALSRVKRCCSSCGRILRLVLVIIRVGEFLLFCLSYCPAHVCLRTSKATSLLYLTSVLLTVILGRHGPRRKNGRATRSCWQDGACQSASSSTWRPWESTAKRQGGTSSSLLASLSTYLLGLRRLPISWRYSDCRIKHAVSREPSSLTGTRVIFVNEA
jgi:hypothetical protein